MTYKLSVLPVLSMGIAYKGGEAAVITIYNSHGLSEGEIQPPFLPQIISTMMGQWSQILGRNFFPWCSLGAGEQEQRLPTRCNP